MKYTKKLDEMLLSDDSSYELKLYSLRKLFKIAEFWSFSKTNQDFLLENKNIESIDLYLDYLEYNTSKYLSQWKNLNTLEDFIELKELLKEMYFDSLIDDLLKRDIINSISFFPTVDDYSFYIQILNDIFLSHEEEVGINIMLNCYAILRFIENNSFDLRIIEIPNKTTKVFHGNRCIIGEDYTYMTILKASKYIKERNLTFTFLEQYNINCQVEILMDISAKATLTYKLIKNKKLEINLVVNAEKIFEISQVNIIEIMHYFSEFLDAYFKKNNLTKIKLETVDFHTKWSKRYDRYLTKMIDTLDKRTLLEIDTRDLLFLFSKMFLHLTLVYEFNYSICLQQETKISKKDYIRLITLANRVL